MRKATNILLLILFLLLFSPIGGTIFYIHNIRWIYILLISFLAAYLFVPVVIRWGIKYGVLDYPSERKIHDHPIPTTGGMAIFTVFFGVLIRNLNFSSEIKGVLLGASIIFLTGIIDDKYELSAKLKLVMQLLATTVLVLFGVKVMVFPYSMPFKNTLDILVTYFGVLGITNAFNYMDGMNGEAGGLAMVSGLALFIISFMNGARHISWLAIALVGSCLGFLPYNFPNAKVFLGDNGSTVIGFLLAAIAIAGSWSAVNITVAIATPLLIFSIYIFDMIYTTVSRIRNGTVKNLKEWFAVTGKDHLHHRLTNLGFNKRDSVIIIWGCSAIFSLSALVIRRATMLNAGVIIIQCLFIYFLIVVLMLAGRKRKV